MEAVDNMSFDSIKCLIENGADSTITDKYGISAIEKAEIKEYHAVAWYLEDNKGVKIKVPKFLYYPKKLKNLNRSKKII